MSPGYQPILNENSKEVGINKEYTEMLKTDIGLVSPSKDNRACLFHSPKKVAYSTKLSFANASTVDVPTDLSLINALYVYEFDKVNDVQPPRPVLSFVNGNSVDIPNDWTLINASKSLNVSNEQAPALIHYSVYSLPYQNMLNSPMNNLHNIPHSNPINNMHSNQLNNQRNQPGLVSGMENPSMSNNGNAGIAAPPGFSGPQFLTQPSFQSLFQARYLNCLYIC